MEIGTWVAEMGGEYLQDYLQLVEFAVDLFNRIIAFYRSIVAFLEDVRTGKYIQTSLEAVLQVRECAGHRDHVGWESIEFNCILIYLP